MIVVLSDLHFSEAEFYHIGDFRFNRNLPSDVFLSYFKEINQIALRNKVNKVDIVLAGDILEISRSGIWLTSESRPYINNDDVKPGSGIEQTILQILETIKKEDYVKDTLEHFRYLSLYFDVEVEAHLILGNHDRLLNATPQIRATVREMFGLTGKQELFPNYLLLNDDEDHPFCLIRHGQEYDPSNFSMNLKHAKRIPVDIPVSVYGQACLGDITTIEFGASLPWQFLKEHGEETILADKELLSIYKRLMEFDDVRPTTAWLSYLFTTPGLDKKKAWEALRGPFSQIINSLGQNPQFRMTLKQSESVNAIARILLIAILKSGIFKRGIPYWMIRWIMKGISRSIKQKPQAIMARREAVIADKNSFCKCVISGHTHFAEVSLLSAKDGVERYYINTGTWRNIIPAGKNYQDFGQLKALTKVIVFYPEEKDLNIEGLEWAFQYFSGVSYGQQNHL
jgi:UDP-2,3-diacylglucosamine pyrophosphatase LpxH